MISLAATHVPVSMTSLRDMMAAHRCGAEKAMAERIQQAQHDGQIGKDVDSWVLAAFFNTMLRGMAIQARDGATTQRLADIAKIAMSAFPSAVSHPL
jgi:hypothetical protein